MTGLYRIRRETNDLMLSVFIFMTSFLCLIHKSCTNVIVLKG